MTTDQLVPTARGPATPASPRGSAAPRHRRSPSDDLEAVLAYLSAQRDAVLTAEAAVRSGSPEGIHDFRVAVRRLRSTLRTFAALLGPVVPVELADELRWLGRRLGAARDQEVLLDRLRADLAELPAELVLGPVRARLEQDYLPRLIEARRQAVEALDGDRYRTVLAALDRLSATPPAGPADSAPTLRRLVRRSRRSAVRRAEAAMQLQPGAPRDIALHRARRAAKRARYAAELAEPVLGHPAQRIVKRAKAVQELLGHHQDDVVAFAELRRLGAAGAAAGENGFTAGLLAGRLVARAERVGADLAGPLRRLAHARL